MQDIEVLRCARPHAVFATLFITGFKRYIYAIFLDEFHERRWLLAMLLTY